MLLDDEKISEILRDLDDEDVTVQKLKAFLNDAEQLTQQLTPSKKARLGAQIIQASSLETLSHVVQMFDLEYLEDEPYIWRVPEGPDVRLSDEAEALLTRMRRANFWGDRGSADGLSRTLIDIVLFDRMDAHQEELAARKLSIRGEVPLEALISSENEIIVVGNADYALGYDPVIPVNSKGFESISVVVEAKRETSETQAVGIAQAVAYMVGIIQKRVNLRNPKRIVHITTYGMVSDGIYWTFLRLDGKCLQVSSSLRISDPDQRSSVYKFVDDIVRSTISVSPHTSSQRCFPATQERWLNNIEPPIFGRPAPTMQQLLDSPEKDFISPAEDYDNIKLQEVEEFDVQRPGPSEVKPCFHVLPHYKMASSMIAVFNSDIIKTLTIPHCDEVIMTSQMRATKCDFVEVPALDFASMEAYQGYLVHLATTLHNKYHLRCAPIWAF
ncbi:hypothetical protein DTO027B3_8287 [Paecilomyces variotii]|nr:hypothetical protein DTO027B3_8287 [Paecilomyces variotii]